MAAGIRTLLPGAVSGALLALSFPNPDIGLLGWVALVPLTLALLKSSFRRGVALGLACGVVFFSVLLYWILGVLFKYSGMPSLLCPLPWLLLVAYLSLYPGLYGGAVALLARRRGPAALAAAPVLWTGLEWARGTLLTGFPWGLLGASQQGVLLVSQAASLAGVYGLTLLLAAFSAALCGLLRCGFRGGVGRFALCLAAGIPLATLLWGWHRLNEPTPPGRPLTVACVQGNAPPDAPEGEGPEMLRKSVRLTKEAASRGARLILWAESSSPYGIEMHEPYRRLVEDLARETGSVLVVNSVGGHIEGPYSNSAFLMSPTGEEAVSYRKIHLVPYGEYVPLSRLTPFVSRLVNAIGDFVPGTRPVVWTAAGARVTPLICYEAIFPSLARRATLAGGEILLNLTNDGWFGRSAGPKQHLALARLRAVETGRPLVRAAETGISAVFDARGRLLARGGLGQQEVVVASVAPGRETTLYLRFGDLLPIGCAIISAVLAAPLFLANKEDNETLPVDGPAAAG